MSKRKVLEKIILVVTFSLFVSMIPKACVMAHEELIQENARISSFVREDTEKYSQNIIDGEEQETSDSQTVQVVNISCSELYESAFQVLELVNQERANAGLNELYMDESLLESAMLRAAEVAVYYSHTRPNGTKCYTANELMFAENIAAGTFFGPEHVMSAWMSSSGHRANILGDYTSIGIGCVWVNGNSCWVQCFGKNTLNADYEQPEDVLEACVDVELSTTMFDGAFEPVLADTELEVGKTTDAILCLINPEFSYLVVTLNDGGGLCWKSSDTTVATIENSGKVQAVGGGTAVIHAELDYYTSNTVEVVVPIIDKSGLFKYKILGDGTIEILEYLGTESTLKIPQPLDGRIITGIGERAFYYDYNLGGTLEIPEGIVYIEEEAFGACHNFIGDLVIPGTVRMLGTSVFGYSLGYDGELILLEGIENIGAYAFGGCSGLKGNIIIPSSVKNIEAYAFYGCNGMERDVYITAATTSIAENAFILSGEDTPQARKEVIIHAPAGSYAEEYAKTYGYSFVACTEKELPTPNPFADIKRTEWQYPYALFALNNNIMNGTGKDVPGRVLFEPNGKLTREQFVQVLYSNSGKPTVTGDNPFADVEDAWYKDAVLWANENGIAKGIGEGNFGVGMNIVRQDLALMLYKYAQMQGYDLTSSSGAIDDYVDVNMVSSYAAEAMNWAVTQGIISGKPITGTDTYKLDPTGVATRAECAAMMMRLLTTN